MAKRREPALLKALILLFLTAGCTAPASYLNYLRMSYDATKMVRDEPTTGDHMLSLMTEMECQAMNLLKAKDICIEEGEAPVPGAARGIK